MLPRKGKNKQKALDLVARYTWQEKESMGIHNFLEMIEDLWPANQDMVITRLQKPDGSHITGPSIAIEGHPSEDPQLRDNCTSMEKVIGGYHYNSCNYTSSTTVCHCDSNGVWSCQSQQTTESSC